MTQTLAKSITFDEFNAQYLNQAGRYELHDGIVIEMPKPKGQHYRQQLL